MGKRIFVIGLSLAAIGSLIFAYSLTRKKTDVIPPAESHEGHNHGEEAESKKPMRYEDVIDMLCDHKIRAIECDECRYEAGVIKVKSALLKSAGNENGLLEIVQLKKEIPLWTISVIGETQADPNKVMPIRAKTSGVVIAPKVDLGSKVASGDIVLEMDGSEYRELHLEFLRLNALIKLAEKNYERENNLFQKKLTTEKEFLEAQAETERLKIELDTIGRKLSLLGLTTDEIKDLSKHTEPIHVCCLPVRTPLAGVVIEKDVTPGAVVESNASLMTIADLSTLWVWVSLYEKDFGILQDALKNGSIKAEITVAAYPDKIFYGKVDYISETMDEHTRTIKARVVMENKGNTLKIGMFVHCKMIIEKTEPVLIIPKDAYLKDNEDTFVFKKVSDDLFFKQPVKAGRTFANGIEILEGLEEGNEIVSEGSFILKSDALREKMGAGCAD